MKRISLIFGLVFICGSAHAGNMPTAITYQGTLKLKGVPANEPHTLSFQLTDVTGQISYSKAIPFENYPIVQGLFSVPLAFTTDGSTPVSWQGITPYIKVTVDGTTLGTPEPINASAYALMSASVADGSITAVKLDPVLQASVTPPGAIIAFGGSMASQSLPAGWLPCDGRTVSRSVYPNLFNAIGTTWGSVNDASFNLPDLQGRAPIGAGHGEGLTSWSVGQSTGEEMHVLKESEMPVHHHDVDIHDQGHTHTMQTSWIAGVAPGTFPIPFANGVKPPFSTDRSWTGITATSRDSGEGQAHNVMQPSVVVSYIIKY